MAFPTPATNGQIYITTDGRRYIYDLTLDSWGFLGNKSVIKDNTTAIAPPTNLDSSLRGYTEGSVWIDSLNKKAYYLVDAMVGNPVWVASGGTAPKVNMTAIVDPVATDDVGLGYSVGSTWRNSVTGVFFDCIDNTLAIAVWKTSGIRPASFIGNAPLLTAVPAISTPIPFVTDLSVDSTNLLGTITISTAGVYEINYTAYIFGSAKRKSYQAQLFINSAPDLITGATTVDRNFTTTAFPRVFSFSKTKQLLANTTLTINHMTDDLLMTIGADISIKRIG